MDSKLFVRDLQKLFTEVNTYEKEEDLWMVKNEIKNSAGNLAIHLCGNLQHFIGAVLGNSDYVRDRPAEFADKNISRIEILKRIETTSDVVESTLDNLTAEQLEKPYPIEVLGYPMTVRYFINHLYGHLGYHLGQINYHRRLLT